MSYSEPREIAEAYARDGFCFPIDVMPEDHAGAYRTQLEDLERRIAGQKGKKLLERRVWNFPQLDEKERVEIELGVEDLPHEPDEIDQRRGMLLRDERLVVEEGILHTKRMLSRSKRSTAGKVESPVCSFCRRPREEVDVLVDGALSSICNKCLDICNEIVASRKPNSGH